MAVDLDERGKALENEYFRRQDEEIIEKIRNKVLNESSVNLNLECPKCDGELHESDYENIKIDICDKCGGVWLDAGELAQVVEQNENSGWLSRLFN